MLNLILAIYYSNYKNRVEKTISNFIEDREKHIVDKFNEFDTRNCGYITPSQCKLLLKELLKIDKDRRHNIINLDKLIEIFDVNGDGRIT